MRFIYKSKAQMPQPNAHTPRTHTPTHSLTQPQPHTHTHMQSGACITLSGARREFRIYATMLPTRPDDTSAQRECLCHSLFLCLRHCLCVCVSVPWCVCVWDKLFKQQLRFLKSTLLCGGAGDSICGKQTSTKLLQPQPTCTDVHRRAQTCMLPYTWMHKYL